MKKGQKPTNFDPAWWKDHKTPGLREHARLKLNLGFLHAAYIHYPRLNLNSTDNAVMVDRVNQIRQMVVGIKAVRDSVNATIRNCLALVHDADKAALKHYLVLLRKAENDRQNWIKMERGVGNLENLQTLIFDQELDDRITI